MKKLHLNLENIKRQIKKSFEVKKILDETFFKTISDNINFINTIIEKKQYILERAHIIFILKWLQNFIENKRYYLTENILDYVLRKTCIKLLTSMYNKITHFKDQLSGYKSPKLIEKSKKKLQINKKKITDELTANKEKLQYCLEKIKKTAMKKRFYIPNYCYISYAWADDEHQTDLWIEEEFLPKLKNHLVQAGIPTLLDRIDNKGSIYLYMEKIKKSSNVIFIGTPSLLKKSIHGVHAIQYEIELINEKRASDSSFVIPILLSGEIKHSFPPNYIGHTLIRDWIKGEYKHHLMELIADLYKIKSTNTVYSEIWRKFFSRTQSNTNLPLTTYTPAPQFNQKFLSSWNLPYTKSQFIGDDNHFVERKLLFKKLADYLPRDSSSNNVIKLVCICGLGGIGKTYLAAYFTYRYDNKYRFRFWINADSKEGIEKQYIELGQNLHALQIFKHYDFESCTRKLKINLVKEYLGEIFGKVLLVYDNATSYQQIQPYLPSHNVDVLVTSRITKWPITVPVNIMSQDESTALLKKLITRNNIKITTNGVKQFVQTLGGLPLAISHASAYIQQDSSISSLEDYIHLYMLSDKKVLLNTGITPIGDEDTISTDLKQSEHKTDILQKKIKTVYVTWDISINMINKHSALANKLLIACAYLHSDNIPKALLMQYLYADAKINTHILLHKELTILDNFSMIKTFGDHISIHRLVQTVIREKLKLNGEKEFLIDLFAKINGTLIDNLDNCQLDINKAANHILHAVCMNTYLRNHRITNFQRLRLLNAMIVYYNFTDMRHRAAICLEELDFLLTKNFDRYNKQHLVLYGEMLCSYAAHAVAHRDGFKKVKQRLIDSFTKKLWNSLDKNSELYGKLLYYLGGMIYEDSVKTNNPNQARIEAINIFHKCLKTFYAMNNKLAQAKIYANIGVSYWQLKCFKLAKKNYKQSIKICHSFDIKTYNLYKVLTYAYGGLGGLMFDKNNPDRNIKASKKYHSMNVEINANYKIPNANTRQHSWPYHWISLIEAELGNFGLAVENYKHYLRHLHTGYCDLQSWPITYLETKDRLERALLECSNSSLASDKLSKINKIRKNHTETVSLLLKAYKPANFVHDLSRGFCNQSRFFKQSYNIKLFKNKFSLVFYLIYLFLNGEKQDIQNNPKNSGCT